MLINVDHITFTCNNIYEMIQYYKNIGYEEVFIVEDIPNPKIKADFMKNYKETQTFCLLKKGSGIPIEIINDSKNISGSSFIKPVFNNDYLIDKVEINVKNKEVLIEQWKNIGFNIIDDSTLTLNGFGKSYNFYINNGDNDSYFLDNDGFVCIALISTSIMKDYNNFKQNMFTVSDIAKLNINNRTLNIFFAQGKNKELFEIIEVTNG